MGQAFSRAQSILNSLTLYVVRFPPFAAVRPPSQGGVSQKAGNLLQATEDYIIHQCNCPRAARQMSMEIVDML